MCENYECNNCATAPETIPCTTAAAQPERPAEATRKGKNGFVRILAIILCTALLSGAAGFGGVLYGMNAASAGAEEEADTSTILLGQRPSTVLDSAAVNTEEAMTPAEIYAAYVRSTVGITTSITTNYFGHQTTSAASGSGFIISPDGYVVTNYHVIEGASAITVTTYDNVAYEATLIGYDESNDLAVLQVEAENLTPVVIGKSDNLNVGDSVLAIGNPLGELTFSLTTGVVSALDREVTLSSSVTMDLIQTDCAINSGNSGGALFNLYGEVIGITNAKYSSGSSSSASIDNIGFAIPISDVMGIIESIIETGTFVKPYVGISVADTHSWRPGSYYAVYGAVVKSVDDNSPAAEVGLQEEDIVIAADGQTVSSSSDLQRIISGVETGERLAVTVYRNGETLDLEVVVGEQVQSALPETGNDNFGSMQRG